MRFKSPAGMMLGLSLLMFGCGKPTPPSGTGGAPAAAGTAARPATSDASANSKNDPATAAPTIDPDTSLDPGTPIPGPHGRIEGVVKFAGAEIPQSTIVTNGTDPQICGAEMSKFDVVISPENRGIRYVLVWLEDVKLPDGYKPPQQNLILDNIKCQFEPHAAAITSGSIIETRNSDEVYHTTNLRGKVTKENIPLVSKGAALKTKVRSAELIGVSCDKHGWMQAFIRVDPHPFHAVTDADGKFSIAGVPVGTYKLKLWHEKFYGQDVEVTVKDGESATLDAKYPVAD